MCIYICANCLELHYNWCFAFSILPVSHMLLDSSSIRITNNNGIIKEHMNPGENHNDHLWPLLFDHLIHNISGHSLGLKIVFTTCFTIQGLNQMYCIYDERIARRNMLSILNIKSSNQLLLTYCYQKCSYITNRKNVYSVNKKHRTKMHKASLILR